jgi:hypothetical protein
MAPPPERLARGEHNGRARLTDDKVRLIRSLHGRVKQKEIAIRVDVSPQTVSYVTRQGGWSHVRAEPPDRQAAPSRG